MRLFILLQYLCPQHFISKVFGFLADTRVKWFKNWAIRYFIRRYGVDLSIAEYSSLEDYPSFNLFFIRKLKKEARPIANGADDIISPADGCISQIGSIHQDHIFQAKGFYFSLKTLLGDAADMAELFQEGYFATIYLAPKDYHRVHMPFTGSLQKTLFVPGHLFSVNHATVNAVPSLFARNERLICLFDTVNGPMAVILIGAMIVGSINTVWQKNAYKSKIIQEQCFSNSFCLERGAELGQFKMGSTVIVLFPKNILRWQQALGPQTSIKMGECIGEYTNKKGQF